MWVKWAQNQNKTQTSIVNLEKEFYNLLTSAGTEITNFIFPNRKVARLSWKYSEDNVTRMKNINVAVAASVTTQARLKLYEYLSKLGKSILYCNTRCGCKITGWNFFPLTCNLGNSELCVVLASTLPSIHGYKFKVVRQIVWQ